MERVGDNLVAVAPAVAFLCTGVALAALLERLGFFDAVIAELGRRHGRITMRSLWWLAAVTTAVLNLDTTIVLLTPLYVGLARRAEGDHDVFSVALVPLLLASFASSVLPVSNLTNLIAAERLALTTSDFLTHLALPSLVAVVVGWSVHRRRLPEALRIPASAETDRRALRAGGAITLFVLVGFVVGPSVGVDAWVVVLAADLVLVALVRWVPWGEVPLATAVALLAAVVVVTLAVPQHWPASVVGPEGWPPVATALGGGVLANLVNNLPAVLVGLEGSTTVGWATWGWLLGVNTAAALLPIGALANLLWWRIVKDEGLSPSPGRYLRGTVAVVLPAFAAATLTLGALHRVAP